MANSSLKLQEKNGLGEGVLILFWVLILGFTVGSCGDIEGDLVSLTVSPSSKTIGINKTELFRATGTDSVGRLVSVSPTWSVSGGIGSISSTGLFAAGAAEGSGSVTATSGSYSSSATVTITAKGWVEGKVQDEIGKKVQGISVFLKSTTLSDLTDSNGEYSISDVVAGTYELWADDPRAVYRSSSMEVTVGSGETVSSKNFTLYYYTKPPDLTTPTY